MLKTLNRGVIWLNCVSQVSWQPDSDRFAKCGE